MTTKTTELYDVIFSAYDLAGRAYSQLSRIVQVVRGQKRNFPSYAVDNALGDIYATLGTIDNARHLVQASDTDDSMSDAILAGKLATSIRQARMMVACLKHNDVLVTFQCELGSIHELLRDAYGPLVN